MNEISYSLFRNAKRFRVGRMADLGSLEQNLKTIGGDFPDIERGDTIRIVHVPEERYQVRWFICLENGRLVELDMRTYVVLD
jgi:hypothetical protein